MVKKRIFSVTELFYLTPGIYRYPCPDQTIWHFQTACVFQTAFSPSGRLSATDLLSIPAAGGWCRKEPSVSAKTLFSVPVVKLLEPSE